MNRLIYLAVLLSSAFTAKENPVISSNKSVNLIGSHDDVSGNCPTGYSQPANSNWTRCYKIFTNFKNKNTAASQCKANNGTLASVQNSFENSYLYSLATQYGATSFWFGIECFNGDVNTCINDDGTPFVYNNFYPGQPNVDGNCVYMSSVGRDSQQWLSFDCEQKFQFVCEKPVEGASVISTTIKPAPTTTIRTSMSPSTTSTTATTTTQQKEPQCPRDYTLLGRMCYKKNYIEDGSSRSDEIAACRQYPGGNMGAITSRDLDHALNNLPCPNPYLRFGLTCSNVTFAGDTSGCVWDDGTPFVYNKFAPQNPKVNTGQQCVYQYFETWYTDPCSEMFSCWLCQASTH